MIRYLFATTLALFLLPQTSEANDIVDFLRAISGPSRSHAAHRDHHVERHSSAHRTVSRRTRLNDSRHFGASHAHEHAHIQSRPVRSNARPTRVSGSGLTFHVSIGNSRPAPVRQYAPLPAPPLPTAPLPAPPRPGQFGHLPHELGDIVTCSVPLFSHVHVESLCCAAPNAVPTLVAIRDPNLNRFRTCIEQMVYVEVMAPPCAPRRVRVSPCRTRIKMDYGAYDITIESKNGCVTVKYDD